MKDGTCVVFKCTSVKNEYDIKYVKKLKLENKIDWISDIKFNPTSTLCAIGSHNNRIWIYDTKSWKKAVKRPLAGHTSYITHIDWSLNGDYLQSNSGDYEILFWDINGKRVTASVIKDENWKTWSCVIGFTV